jgi:hypothetical protein
MSELSDLEARLKAEFQTVRGDIISWRWYVLVALVSLAAGFLFGHFH